MAKPKPKTDRRSNLGKWLHPAKAKAPAKAPPKTARTHLDKPSKPATAKVVTGRKAPRADFALSGGRFPMNTAGRRQVADKDAAIARNAGTITAAEQAKVKADVKTKRPVVKTCAKCGKRTSAAICPSCGKKM